MWLVMHAALGVFWFVFFYLSLMVDFLFVCWFRFHGIFQNDFCQSYETGVEQDGSIDLVVLIYTKQATYLYGSPVSSKLESCRQIIENGNTVEEVVHVFKVCLYCMKMLVDVCNSLHSCEVLCLEVCSVCSKPSSHAFSSINQPPDPLSHLPSLCQWAVNCLAHCPTAILALWPPLPSSIPLPVGCQLPGPLSYHNTSPLTHFTIFYPSASGLSTALPNVLSQY